LALLAILATKGGARENRPPRGVEKSMLIFEGIFGKIVSGKRGYEK
jgi:hypothetical protein